MSTANLTPEQQQVLSLIQMFENTGGSKGYLRHLEAAQSTTENAPQIDKNERGLIYTEVDIDIEAGTGLLQGTFFITVTTKDSSGRLGVPVYQGKGYGFAKGEITTKPFSGSLTLKAPGWDPVLKAEEVPFKWVKVYQTMEPLIEWEGFVDGSPVMSFGGVARGEAGLETSYGVMKWKQLLPFNPKE